MGNLVWHQVCTSTCDGRNIKPKTINVKSSAQNLDSQVLLYFSNRFILFVGMHFEDKIKITKLCLYLMV